MSKLQKIEEYMRPQEYATSSRVLIARIFAYCAFSTTSTAIFSMMEAELAHCAKHESCSSLS